MMMIVVTTVTAFKTMMSVMLMKTCAFTELCRALNNGVTSEVILHTYFNEQHERAEEIFLSSTGSTSFKPDIVLFYSPGNHQYIKYMSEFKMLYS